LKFQQQIGINDHGELDKVSASECENDRQPEIAISPPKPEIFIHPELWQVMWKF